MEKVREQRINMKWNHSLVTSHINSRDYRRQHKNIIITKIVATSILEQSWMFEDEITLKWTVYSKVGSSLKVKFEILIESPINTTTPIWILFSNDKSLLRFRGGFNEKRLKKEVFLVNRLLSLSLLYNCQHYYLYYVKTCSFNVLKFHGFCFYNYLFLTHVKS